MNIVDASGWIEYIADHANARFFEPPIVDSENLLIPTICLYEVFKRAMEEFGEERTLDAMGIMSLGTIIDLDRHSVILATARAYDTMLWTQGEHFKRIEGVKFKEKRSRK